MATARTRDHPGVDGELEAQRIKSHYRRLVLLGKAKLPVEAARKLVGPDCAYHLYFRHAPEPPVEAEAQPHRVLRECRARG